MQISVIEPNLKCGVCAHMHSATSVAEDHEDAYTHLLPLCKKNMILLRQPLDDS